ncbi:MAG TPA: glucoamylase family protein, partial [Planctomycetota bacterium]|nr:glucoamylase family protein [Planctomycetota bacterium]
HCESDEGLLKQAIACMEELNQRYGGNRFFLFHRDRKWCEGEQKYIGWERKRGKLEELNDLIAGRRPADADRLVYVGDANSLTDVQFVLTLDSDTQSPAGVARRLIETISHPLNRVQHDADGRIVSGYTIIQPSVRPNLPSTSKTPFSRLFANVVGIDPYPTAASDTYQDLTGEGSYHGKGIYDVRAFSRVLSSRFPEARLLSHDLIEGAYVRVGLASDIELYDEFPQDYLSYCKRQHRWIRGDWQIAEWVSPLVPQAGGGTGLNPLSWFNRWKILDNLRRSLLPAGNLALLLGGWLISFQAGAIATTLVAIQMCFHCLIQPLTLAVTRRTWKDISLAQIAHDLLRVLVEIAMLPYQAGLALDAIARVLYRRYISHRGLLEWVTAQATQTRVRTTVPIFIMGMGLASLFSVLAGVAVGAREPESLRLAIPWLMLWFASPICVWLLNERPEKISLHKQISADDRRYLQMIARRTWRFFSDFVTEQTNWLPPDNFQVAYAKGLALRTSPTNLGMYLVSVLGAHEFGYLTADEVVQRLNNTLETVKKLERYQGHLLNWYDIQTLAPLLPRYVSMVDSGNLLGSLWTLARGLDQFAQQPVLDSRALMGLRDSARILREAIEAESGSPVDLRALKGLLQELPGTAQPIRAIVEFLRRNDPVVNRMVTQAAGMAAEHIAANNWAQQMQKQLAADLSLSDRYLSWIPILAEKTEADITVWNPAALEQYREALTRAPSLRDLAGGQFAAMTCLQSLQTSTPETDAEKQAWLERLRAALDRSKWLAGEMQGMLQKVSTGITELAESMNLRFLYDDERRLFTVGFNVTENRQDHSYYDLLESEARLGSLIAIAHNDVPVEHWFAMSRAYGAVGVHRTLLSWNGTMFEYMMPQLFQKSYEQTLLHQASSEAVDVQIAFGRRHHIPWGISECAFADLDLGKTYQYRAFGVPELGLKHGLAERTVVAPYATLLALAVRPQESINNLKELAEMGMLGEYGFYESLDYHRQPAAEAAMATIVRTYMAHHQGMSFLSLTNVLKDDCLIRYFHTDPRVRTVEPLLHERIPLRPPLHHIATRERATAIAITSEYAPAVSQFDSPHTDIPRVQLLCNGRFQTMVTASGGGYSRWNQFDITRWRSDPTRDPWGTFCYIREAETGRIWCNSYQPTGGRIEAYRANFTLGSAVFRRIDQQIECKSEIIVAPEDDVEIRRISLFNRSDRTRRLELTSYMELALAPHSADRQHPAFNKMFIQTEALPAEGALLAWRRQRNEKDPAIVVGHRMTLEPGSADSADPGLRFETDRRRFIGRGATLANPMGAWQQPGGSQGYVLDPIFSLRREVTLEPGQRVRLSLVLGAGATREHVVGLMTKYSDPRAISRASEFAWSAAQLELRLLHIQPDEARRFQQMASHLLYPNRRLRPTGHRLAENRKGQSGLWAYAISGDLPIALVIIGKTGDQSLVRQLLQAHSYWRMHGLVADLVIVNEEAGGYNEPLREDLERLIHFHGASTGINRPGGIFLLSASKLSSEDRTLLRAVASIVLVGAR